MPVRHPSDWEGLFDILQAWLFNNDPSVILDTTGNAGNLLEGLGVDSTTEDTTAIALENTLDDEEGGPVIAASDNHSEEWFKTIGVADYLRSLPKEGDKSRDDRSSTAPADDPSAGAVCCFEMSHRRQYTDDDIPGYLENSLGVTGRPQFERVLSALVALHEGGRGLFIVPRSMLASYESVFEYLQGFRLHAIIDLNPNRFRFEEIDQRLDFSVILVKRNSTDEDDLVRHITLDRFDDRLGALIHSPTAHLSGIELTDDNLDLTTVDQQVFTEFPPHVACNVPHLLPIFRSEEFVSLREIDAVTVHRGAQLSPPEAFYFTPEEIKKSAINSELFTPIITRDALREATYSIAESEVEQLVLDLRQPIREIEEENSDLSKKEILKELRRSGYEHAVDYVTSNVSDWNPRMGYWFCPFLHQYVNRFALVTPELSADAEWIRVDLNSVVLDRLCIGIACTDSDAEQGISQIIQTQGYQRLIEKLFDSSFGGVIQYNKYLINEIPIPCRALTENFRIQTESIYPPESYRDEVRLTELLQECVHEEPARETLGRLLEPNDEYAWAWFLSPDEYQEFTQKWETDSEDAKQFVANRLTEEDVKQIERDLKRDSIPSERSKIVTELLEEYRNRKNRLFLYGATPQFEGVLVDWAERNGHTIEEDEDGSLVVNVGDEEAVETVPKTLSGLLQHYLRDGFGEFLHEHVRTSRNEVAHGAIVENDRSQATMFLLCLYALYRRTMLNTKTSIEYSTKE
jgi:hypothetical protein